MPKLKLELGRLWRKLMAAQMHSYASWTERRMLLLGIAHSLLDCAKGSSMTTHFKSTQEEL
jgi:hypothetical protein